ncbi:serine hydrolase domain-containing protein [Nocardia sp. NPDC003482]
MRLSLLPPAAAILAAVAMLVSGCPAPVPPAPPPPDGLAAVRAQLDSLLAAGAVGALATVTDGDRTATLAAGSADTATGTPMPADRPQYVRVGSITKSFTAVLTLQLAAENALALDDPIDTYLPGLLRGDGVDGRAITVRQLLQHRSGLPELVDDPSFDEFAAARAGYTVTPQQEIAATLRMPAQFPPGTRYRYTNVNYIVAGMLIERVTGHSYAEELQRRILAPLNLVHTYLPATGEVELRAPHPHAYSGDPPTDVTRIEPSIPWTAGSLVSGGADPNRFYTALLTGRLIDPVWLARMLDGVPADDSGRLFYGLGVITTELPCGTRFVGHVGGIQGFRTIAGATSAGRAVTVVATGLPDAAPLDVATVLARTLCP